MDLTYENHIILTKKGIKALRACPITDIVVFSELLSFLTGFLVAEKVTLSLALKTTEIEQIVTQLLGFHGLTPDELEDEQIEQLLSFPDGLLVKINKLGSSESKEVKTGEGITLKEYELKLITGLVNADLARSFEEAYQIASHYPSDYLYACLTARFAFLNPDGEKQIEKEKNNRELLELLNKEMFSTDPIKKFKKE